MATHQLLLLACAFCAWSARAQNSIGVLRPSSCTAEGFDKSSRALVVPKVKEDPAEQAKEWLEELEQFTKTAGSIAKLFEEDAKEESEAFQHAFGLIGAVSGLIAGFLGTSPSKEYVKAIQELQEAFDKAIAVIQQQLAELTKDIQEDFMKTLLAPKATILHDMVSALTVLTNSSHSKTAKKVWMAQVEPINDRVDAWNSIALCLIGELTTCPPDALDIILGGGASWPRPAVLTQFVAYHYSMLASSASAICTYQEMKIPGGGNCSLIDLSRLQKVAKRLSNTTTAMKTGFWASVAADKIPSVIAAQAAAHDNGGFDGAKALTQSAHDEIKAFYLDNDMGSFFGFSSFSVVAQIPSGGGNWEAHWFSQGWNKNIYGYSIVYNFDNLSSYAYGDSDCHTGDVTTQATCLNAMHQAGSYVFNAGRRRYSVWMAANGEGYYWKKYSDTDLRLVSPGTAAGANGPSSGGMSFSGHDNSSAPEEVPRLGGAVALRGADTFVPSDPSSIMKDIANVFDTAGAIAEFFGPEGEAVALVLDIVAGIFNLIAGLLGMGQPDPVIIALRNFEKDIMAKLIAVSDQVEQAKNTAALGAIKTVLNNAEVPLLDLIGYWNTFYPNGSKKGKINKGALEIFKLGVGDNIAKYRDSWNTLVECLSGTNVDCVLQGKSALDIMLMDGQDFARPLVLTNALKYYFAIVQKSSVVICAYAKYALGDKTCSFLPGLQSGLQSLATGMKGATTRMLTDHHASMGADKLLPVIKYYVDMNANKGFDGAKAITAAVETELSTFYLADGLDNFFGSRSHMVVVLNNKDSGSGNWQAAWVGTGWLKEYNGYDVMYAFQNSTTNTYPDTDCRSGSVADMSTCLNKEHGAANFVQQAGRRRYSIFMSATGAGYYWKKYSDSDLRMVTPGSGASDANDVGPTSMSCEGHSDSEDSETALVI